MCNNQNKNVTFVREMTPFIHKDEEMTLNQKDNKNSSKFLLHSSIKHHKERRKRILVVYPLWCSNFAQDEEDKAASSLPFF
jgi:hypothetical protein